MGRVLLTGARGFTGAFVRKELEQAGYEVVGTLAHGDAGAEGERLLDICSLDECRRVMGEVQPTHIVHLAAISFVAHDDVLQMYAVNVLGTMNLLKACADVGLHPQRVLLASSANVYGNAAGTVDERVQPAPVNHYAASKLAMEHLARTWCDRFPIVITRPFNYTGRGQESRFLVPKIVSHFASRQPYIELGNLDVARDFSDVRTVAGIYRKLLEAPVAGEVLNVCSGHAHTLYEIVDMVREASGHDLEVRVNPSFVRDNEVKVLVGCSSKLQVFVSDVQRIELTDTIRWMLQPVDSGALAE
jgi:nucleoside-diphosphate-sugar epimerase